eukprot:8138-Eustigmatos_ZCMA.PRE.1
MPTSPTVVMRGAGAEGGIWSERVDSPAQNGWKGLRRLCVVSRSGELWQPACSHDATYGNTV